MNAPNPFAPPQSKVADLPQHLELDSRPPERPNQVKFAFGLLAGSVALGVLNYILGGMQGSSLFSFLVLAFVFGLAAAIRSGKNWARIVFLVLYLTGLPSLFFASDLITQGGKLFFAVFCLQTLLQGLALWLVFRKPGSVWFKRAISK